MQKKVLFIAFMLAIVFLFGHFVSQGTVQGQQVTSFTAGVGTPTLDGVEDPGEWTSDSITTSRGVTIKAMMDEDNFYILATWPDSTMSVRSNHWTWDGQQWNASEDEDRIAFIWEMTDAQGNSLNGANGPSCATMCHPGQGMATALGRVDVWHSKSTRFLPIGYTDDKYWDTDGPDGRHGDTGVESGDRNRNDAQTGPEFRAASGPSANVTFLVEDQETLDSFNQFGTQLGTADLRVPIGENDQFNVGDTIAGRILKNPTGNRASVRSVGSWENGMWTVEFSRKLAGEVDEQGNPQDFAAIPGGSVRFTTEIFDNLSDHENHSFSAAGNANGADFTVWTLFFPDPTTLYLAQTGNGGGFTADHVFTNPRNDVSVRATMNLFDDLGAPLPIDIAAIGSDRHMVSQTLVPTELRSSVEFEVPPLGTVTVSTSGSGDVVDGAAEVLANYPLGGVIRFRIPGVGIAGVGESRSLRAFIVPVRRISGGVNTGIAIHHTRTTEAAPQGQGLTLNLSLRNAAGQEVATQTISNFAPRGHLADFINEAALFGDYFSQGGETDNFNGTLVVTVEGGEVAATALELGPNPGEFTTLPVTELK